MNAAQPQRRQQEPPARGRMAAGNVRRLGVHLCKFELSTRQTLFGRSRQPSHRLPLVALDGIAVIVQSVGVYDAEVAPASPASASRSSRFSSRQFSTGVAPPLLTASKPASCPWPP